MDQKLFTTSMGVIRTGVGLALVAAPAKAGHLWIGEHATGGGTKVLARALGARDVVLGGAIIAASSSDPATAGRLVKHGALVDLADVLATVVAYRHLEGSRRITMPIVAAVVAVAGGLMWKMGEAIEEDATEGEGGSRADGTGTPDAGVAERAGIVDQQDAVLVSTTPST